jgi:hypothetical protein
MFRTIALILLGVLALSLTSTSEAALVAAYSKTQWDNSKQTHVIIASKGLPFMSVGYTQANVIKEMYPDNQILFITNLPPATSNYRNTKQRDLQREDFVVVEERDTPLTNKAFMRIITERTSNIRSIDIIGHNGVDLGPWLENGETRLDYKNEAFMSQLKPLFNEKALARLQGCNTGWNVAPKLSKAWGIPVLGSFTSTSFYFLAKTGAYELVHGETAPERIASVDRVSFVSDNGQPIATPCAEGMCQTLIPEAAPYHFHVHRSPNAAWLPYRKAICDSSISDARCETAWAEGILTSITPLPRKTALANRDAFKQMLEHSVCASHSSKAAQDVCVRSLRRAQSEGNSNYLPYRAGETLKCSGLRACRFVQDSIDLRRNASSSTENSIQLYFEHALRGHELLGGRL